MNLENPYHWLSLAAAHEKEQFPIATLICANNALILDPFDQSIVDYQSCAVMYNARFGVALDSYTPSQRKLFMPALRAKAEGNWLDDDEHCWLALMTFNYHHGNLKHAMFAAKEALQLNPYSRLVQRQYRAAVIALAGDNKRFITQGRPMGLFHWRNLWNRMNYAIEEFPAMML